MHAARGTSAPMRPQGVRHVVAVASGKGGVGKSTVAGVCTRRAPTDAHRSEPRGSAGAAGGGAGGHFGRGHLRSVDAPYAEPARAATGDGGEAAGADGELRAEDAEHGQPGGRGQPHDLARPHGDDGHRADAAPDRLGAARRARRGPAAGHGRHPPVALAALRPLRRRHRLHAPGHRPHRRQARRQHVPEGERAGAAPPSRPRLRSRAAGSCSAWWRT